MGCLPPFSTGARFLPSNVFRATSPKYVEKCETPRITGEHRPTRPPWRGLVSPGEATKSLERNKGYILTMLGYTP